MVREVLSDSLIGHLCRIWHDHKDEDGSAGYQLTSGKIADTLELHVHTQVPFPYAVLSR